MKKVSLVIPNWNGRKFLEKNMPVWLRSVENKNNLIGELIIIDDKSTDDSVEYLKKNYGTNIKLVCHKVNRGFSSTVNTGFRTAKYPIVCLINTDVVPQKNFLRPVISLFKDKNLFAVSLHEKGFGKALGKFQNGFIVHTPGGESLKTASTFWVSGGSGVFSRKIWMELGGLDENIFSPFYWEDVDISYRAMKRGFKLLWEPKAHVVHEHEGVINQSNFKMRKVSLIKERNHLLFNWKNLTSRNLRRKHRIGLIKRLRKHPGYIKVVLYALVKYSLVLKARRKEYKEEKISDEAIFASFE